MSEPAAAFAFAACRECDAPPLLRTLRVPVSDSRRFRSHRRSFISHIPSGRVPEPAGKTPRISKAFPRRDDRQKLWFTSALAACCFRHDPRGVTSFVCAPGHLPSLRDCRLPRLAPCIPEARQAGASTPYRPESMNSRGKATSIPDTLGPHHGGFSHVGRSPSHPSQPSSLRGERAFRPNASGIFGAC
jgi:hypothetical protein